jgi:hypothetical protein
VKLLVISLAVVRKDPAATPVAKTAATWNVDRGLIMVLSRCHKRHGPVCTFLHS